MKEKKVVCNCENKKEKCVGKKNIFKYIILFLIIICLLILSFYLGKSLVKSDNSEIKCSENSIEFIDENDIIEDLSLSNEEAVTSLVVNILDGNCRKQILSGELESFKAGYTLMQYFSHDGSISFFKADFLKNEIEKIFAEGVGLEHLSINKSVNFWFGYNLVCDDSICVVKPWLGGGTGRAYYDIELIDQREEDGNKIYFFQEYYLDFDTDDYICDVYTELEGDILSKGSCDDKDERLEKIDKSKLNNYEVVINSDNQFVSIEKIN